MYVCVCNNIRNSKLYIAKAQLEFLQARNLNLE